MTMSSTKDPRGISKVLGHSQNSFTQFDTVDSLQNTSDAKELN
jgi:hypothetical protein